MLAFVSKHSFSGMFAQELTQITPKVLFLRCMQYLLEYASQQERSYNPIKVDIISNVSVNCGEQDNTLGMK